MYSMQSYYGHTLKMKYMEEIFHDHYQNYWKEKKSMRSNQSSNIHDGVKDTNTTSNGKVIPSLKQHGKTNQHSLTMGICYNSTKYVIKFDVSDNLHHNMFLQKKKSTPVLKTSPILIDENEPLNQNINHLQKM